MAEKSVGFGLKKISTEQFATNENVCFDDESIQLGISIEFGIDEQHKMIGCASHFQFSVKDTPFIIIKVKCEFAIENISWSNFTNNENNSITFPQGFMTHLAVITVGTTRGVLHCKTENTPFNKYFLPTINVNELVTGDIVFKLEKIKKRTK